MANETVNLDFANILLYVSYIGGGGLMSILNLIIFFVIVRTKEMVINKSYLVLAGQAFMNNIAGLAFLAAGINSKSLFY
jgi:hypothetical protein